MATTPKPVGRAPTHATLREAALRHLSRFAATEAGIVRVLDRRVQRWAHAAEREGLIVDALMVAARADVRAVARVLVETGVVDDAAFATARARRLARTGKSRQATSAHLAARGVSAETAKAALADNDELPIALAFARRRRIGPFRTPADSSARLKDLGILARAGFARDIAERALDIGVDEAAALVVALKNR